MNALERLNAAEQALTDARKRSVDLADAGQRIAARMSDIEQRRATLDAQLADLAVDVELGERAEGELTTLRIEVDQLGSELETLKSTGKAADKRLQEAATTEQHAERELKNATKAVASPLAEQARNRARAAFASFVAYQREWLELSAAAGLPNTGEHLQHGPADRADSLPGIAKARGINATNLGPSGPLTATSIDALRRMAARDDGLE